MRIGLVSRTNSDGNGNGHRRSAVDLLGENANTAVEDRLANPCLVSGELK
jgi:hypothetical protein